MATTPQPRVDDDDGDIVHDDLIGSAESGGSSAGNLFDLRTIIGGLFTLYGVFLIILGAFDSPEEVAKAADVRINLWTGLGLLALGLSFLLWVRLRPLTLAEVAAATSEDGDADGDGGAAATQSSRAGGPGRTSSASSGGSAPGP